MPSFTFFLDLLHVRASFFHLSGVFSFCSGVLRPFLSTQTVPDAELGVRIKTALEIESGSTGVGAALLSHNVNNLFIASKDMHKNQVQFALERGMPAMLADFGANRLPYPSQAFDLIYCLKCDIEWGRDGRQLLDHL